MRTRAVQLLVNDSLPEHLRQYDRVLDSKALGRLLHSVALDAPDQYAKVVKSLGDIGRNAAYWQGESMGIDDLRDQIDTPSKLAEMDAEVATALRGGDDEAERRAKRESIWGKWAAKLEREVMSSTKPNSVLDSVRSGARGKPLQARAMLSTPALFEDSSGKMVPIFARSSYSRGVSPAEWLAGAYGARSSVSSTKRATAKGGAWSKLLGQVAAPIMVTENDCGTTNGIDLLADDKSVRNRVLAQDAGKVTSGTLLGRKELAELRNKHKGPLIVRSAITCESPHGVCARCLGADPDGKYPKIGFAAGITASTALGEPVTQSSLNLKHTSGASSQKREYSGLSWLERFVQIPDNFPDRSPVADADGIVSVKAAPQGGNYVQVGDKEHYVPQHLAVTVKNGDRVEAGQQLSEGIVRPDDIVRYRGIGEGRRYYADRLKQMLDEGGTGADRRNTEVVARGAIDHVQVEDPDDLPDGALPDDMVSYQRALRSFTPPEDSQELNPKNALGLYLQKPALHFTPGTRITPRVADKLAATGFNKVLTHAKAPAFTPRMQRLQTQAFANDDWLASMHTSYLGRQLAQGVTRGQETDVERNIHFAPRLAFGEGFGKDIETTGHF